jgi:hypothetical protein
VSRDAELVEVGATGHLIADARLDLRLDLRREADRCKNHLIVKPPGNSLEEPIAVRQESRL